LELDYFDLGGEGIAYHDLDSINQAGRKAELRTELPLVGQSKTGRLHLPFLGKRRV